MEKLYAMTDMQLLHIDNSFDLNWLCHECVILENSVVHNLTSLCNLCNLFYPPYALDYNGSEWCYRSLIETVTDFLFFEGTSIAAPGWVRSLPFKGERYLRLFRSASRSNEWVALILGVFLTLSTALLAILGRKYATKLLVRPYELPRAQCGC